jgi:hypothetical protein
MTVAAVVATSWYSVTHLDVAHVSENCAPSNGTACDESSSSTRPSLESTRQPIMLACVTVPSPMAGSSKPPFCSVQFAAGHDGGAPGGEGGGGGGGGASVGQTTGGVPDGVGADGSMSTPWSGPPYTGMPSRLTLVQTHLERELGSMPAVRQSVRVVLHVMQTGRLTLPSPSRSTHVKLMSCVSTQALMGDCVRFRSPQPSPSMSSMPGPEAPSTSCTQEPYTPAPLMGPDQSAGVSVRMYVPRL